MYLNRLERLNQPINDNKYAKFVNVFVLFKRKKMGEGIVYQFHTKDLRDIYWFNR